MPIVIAGGDAYDPNIAEDQAALFALGFEYHNGQWVQVHGNDVVIEQAPPSVYTSVGTPAIGNTAGIPTSQPGIVTNPLVASSILGGAWSGFNPSDLAGGLAVLHAYSLQVYGSVELGVIRRSSEVLENEPSGIRPGTLERIVIPTWARRERGNPF